MSQEPDNRIPTPVMMQIQHNRELIQTYPKYSKKIDLAEVCIFCLEMILEDERRAIMMAHASARGMREVDPIAILWFTKTFLPYENPNS